jgi:hypothetical protein
VDSGTALLNRVGDFGFPLSPQPTQLNMALIHNQPNQHTCEAKTFYTTTKQQKKQPETKKQQTPQPKRCATEKTHNHTKKKQ